MGIISLSSSALKTTFNHEVFGSLRLCRRRRRPGLLWTPVLPQWRCCPCCCPRCWLCWICCCSRCGIHWLQPADRSPQRCCCPSCCCPRCGLLWLQCCPCCLCWLLWLRSRLRLCWPPQPQHTADRSPQRRCCPC